LALADRCDVVTAEIEHINTDGLQQVEERKVEQGQRATSVQPTAATIRVIQDKLAQKVHLQKFGEIPLPEFADTPTIEDARAVGEKFGYDSICVCRHYQSSFLNVRNLPHTFRCTGQLSIHVEEPLLSLRWSRQRSGLIRRAITRGMGQAGWQKSLRREMGSL
jgi:hypothetical protein